MLSERGWPHVRPGTLQSGHMNLAAAAANPSAAALPALADLQGRARRTSALTWPAGPARFAVCI